MPGPPPPPPLCRSAWRCDPACLSVAPPLRWAHLEVLAALSPHASLPLPLHWHLPPLLLQLQPWVFFLVRSQ